MAGSGSATPRPFRPARRGALGHHESQPLRLGDSVKFNETAARVMKKHGVPTLDLYTPSKKEHEERFHNRMRSVFNNDLRQQMEGKKQKERPSILISHYFPHGSQALAEIVAKDVLERLKD